MWLKRLLKAAIVVGLLASTARYSAAETGWLKDRKAAEGMGYRVGNLELHPGIGGEFGYDSNMFQRHSAETPARTLRFRITPSLSLSTLGEQRRGPTAPPPKLVFSAGLSATYNEYIRVNDTRDNVGKFRNLGANLDLDLLVNPTGPFGGHLYGNAVRTIQPSNFSDLSTTYNRVYLRGGGELMWLPGGGLFDWRLGYEYGATLFEQRNLTALNNGMHTIATRGRWRFFPKTALLFELTQSFLRYGDTEGRRYLLDSDPLRASIGMNGLFTNHFALLAMVGWGVSFQKEGAVPAKNFDSLLAHVQASYFPNPGAAQKDLTWETAGMLSKISLGYNRNFQNSYLGNYYQRDRGYLNGTYMFSGRVLTTAEVGVARLGFPTLYFSDGTHRSESFSQLMIDASLFVEYRVIHSVGINTTIDFTSLSDHELPIDPALPDQPDHLGFNRFQAFIGVRWFM